MKFFNQMKKSNLLIMASIAMAFMMSVTSCVSPKKIIYFQNSDSVFAQAQQIMQQYEMRIKPADQVLVKVTCSEPDLLVIFAQDVVMGSQGSVSSYNLSQSGNMSNAYGYTVTNDGNVLLPAIGRVHVAGHTCEEAAKIIEQSIVNHNLIKDPEVTVQLMNARVSVLGAVKAPGVVNLTSERNTILDVLSRCGDVSDAGLRKNVSLYREVDGKRMKYNIDLTKSDVFENPAYYVQQNDMIYVQPNKSQSVKSSAFSTFLAAGSSIIGVVSAVISMVFLIVK